MSGGNGLAGIPGMQGSGTSVNPIAGMEGLFATGTPASTSVSETGPAAGIRFASQLTQMKEMGFYDEAANIAALSATGGNVSAAIERLLSQF